MKLIGRYTDLSEAQIVVGVLQSHGINTELRDYNTASIGFFIGALGGVRLYVSDDDFQQAIKVLNSKPDPIPGSET